MKDQDPKLRILFAPETFNLGETSRAVEVARQIRSMGHEVLFMGYSERFADYVRDAGFPLELLDPALTEKQADQIIAVDQGRSLRHPFSDDMVRRRVSSECKLLRRWRPDCVVIGTTLTLFISARAARVPLVYVRPYAMSRGHVANIRSFPITQGESGWDRKLNHLTGLLIGRVAPRVRWKPASFRRVSAERHVCLPMRTLDAIDADLNLIASLFPYLDTRLLAPGEIAVGPIYAHGDGDLPRRVATLAESERPVVYVGLGSSASRRLVLKILHDLAPLNLDIVSSTGRYLSAEDRLRLPNNVQIYDFLPAHKLTGIISASVIHGGEGTVQTACASGAPFAGIGLQAEQRINLDECVQYGNALRFTPRDLRKGRLPQIVMRLLEESEMHRVARELQAAAQPVGAANAAEEILTYVGSNVG